MEFCDVYRDGKLFYFDVDYLFGYGNKVLKVLFYEMVFKNFVNDKYVGNVVI